MTEAAHFTVVSTNKEENKPKESCLAITVTHDLTFTLFDCLTFRKLPKTWFAIKNLSVAGKELIMHFFLLCDTLGTHFNIALHRL